MEHLQTDNAGPQQRDSRLEVWQLSSLEEQVARIVNKYPIWCGLIGLIELMMME